MKIAEPTDRDVLNAPHETGSTLLRSASSTVATQRIGVIIPCYRVQRHVLDVLARIGPEVDRIYVVDDACPEKTGQLVRERCKDPRVKVLTLETNLGVGGAVIAGYRAAMKDGCDVLVKLDGDNQMDPREINTLIAPLIERTADYAKGNRFFELSAIHTMPRLRLFGNALLSFVNKATSGYWHVMDPTNGFTAIHVEALRRLPLDKLDRRYFFESDMLFRLGTVRAVVTDVPMNARYGDEESNLSIRKVALEFPLKYVTRFFKRVLYSYFLRDFNAGTLSLTVGTMLCTFGGIYGLYQLMLANYVLHRVAATGVVMTAALPIILGWQALLAALSFDVSNVPTQPLLKRPQPPPAGPVS